MTLALESFQNFFEVGGWAMYGIVICSVVALTLFLERLWSLRATHVVPENFAIDAESLIAKGDYEQARVLCRKSNSTLARIVDQGLAQLPLGVTAARQMMDEETERQSFVLERGVGVLNMITTLAPLLGFLGTVLGMVALFSSIAEQGEIQNVGVIADGVYQALYTTVAGLTVAIPTTVFHKVCLSRIDQHLLSLEEHVVKFVSVLNQQGFKGPNA